MDRVYMDMAYEQAEKSVCLRAKVGAIIVKDDKVVAKAYNKKEQKNQPIAHAEILAIQKACKKLNTWHLDDCVMYVTLEPCVMCAGALIQARIKKVIYGAKSYQDGAIESALKLYEIKGFNHYPETMYFDKLEECSKIISNYFKTKR